MRGNVEIFYEKGEMEEYVSEILTLGLCDLFFCGSFLEKDGGRLGCYKTEGFHLLSSVTEMDTGDVLLAAAGILRGIRQAEQRYICPELYRIDEETVFTDRGISQIKLIFRIDTEKQPAERKLSEYLRCLRKKSRPEGLAYVDAAVELVEKEEFGYRAAIRRLEELRREVYLCDVR